MSGSERFMRLLKELWSINPYILIGLIAFAVISLIVFLVRIVRDLWESFEDTSPIAPPPSRKQGKTDHSEVMLESMLEEDNQRKKLEDAVRAWRNSACCFDCEYCLSVSDRYQCTKRRMRISDARVRSQHYCSDYKNEATDPRRML